MDTSSNSSLVACNICGQVHEVPALRPGTAAKCSRCGSTLRKRTLNSLHMTAALSLAAIILYLPANIFPIMRMDINGATSENTVWQGCVLLFRDGQWIVAVIVFLASILIPLLKLLGLFLLVGSTRFARERARVPRTWLFKVVDGVGRWAMLDVFVLAILVSLVKLQRLATILPGPGLVAFSGVVVLTLLASASFDPQLIWENPKEES